MNLWPAYLPKAQYDFLAANIADFPAFTSEFRPGVVEVPFTVEELRRIMPLIDKLASEPQAEFDQGEMGGMYVNVAVAYHQYEDFMGLSD